MRETMRAAGPLFDRAPRARCQRGNPLPAGGRVEYSLGEAAVRGAWQEATVRRKHARRGGLCPMLTIRTGASARQAGGHDDPAGGCRAREHVRLRRQRAGAQPIAVRVADTEPSNGTFFRGRPE